MSPMSGKRNEPPPVPPPAADLVPLEVDEVIGGLIDKAPADLDKQELLKYTLNGSSQVAEHHLYHYHQVQQAGLGFIPSQNELDLIEKNFGADAKLEYWKLQLQAMQVRTTNEAAPHRLDRLATWLQFCLGVLVLGVGSLAVVFHEQGIGVAIFGTAFAAAVGFAAKRQLSRSREQRVAQKNKKARAGASTRDVPTS